MKIIVTCETYLPRVGGAEIHVKNLFSRLKEGGYEVSLLTNEPGEELESVVRIPWSKRSVLKLLKTAWQMTNHVSVIHSHYCHRLAFIMGCIGTLRNIPVIVTLHGMGILDHPGASFRARISHSFYRYWSLKLCTHVISTSEDLAIVAERFISRKKLTVIMNGYDASQFNASGVSARLDKTQKTIVTVRRLVPKNGIHYLIEAMPLIIKEIPNIHYFIAGDGPMRNHIENRIKALSLDNNVTVLGMVPNNEVMHYLKDADVVVFPSTAESSSIACAEAMGMQKTIVASRVGGLVELLGKNEERGYLADIVSWTGSNYNAPLNLPNESYQVLADKIVNAITNTKDSAEKALAGKDYAEQNLTWDAIFKKTIIIYDKK